MWQSSSKKSGRHDASRTTRSVFLVFVQFVFGIADLVFRVADRTFRLAFQLVVLAFGLKLGIVKDAAGRFLRRALGLVERSLDAILIHLVLLASLANRTREPWSSSRARDFARRPRM